MKKITKIIAALILGSLVFHDVSAQNAGKGNIEITPYIETSSENIPYEAQNLLTNRLAEVLTQNGVIRGINSKFVLTANIVVVGQEVTPTTPPMHVYNFEVTFYIGNGIDGNLFSSESLPLKGLGTTQTKAYIEAFKNLNPKSTILTGLIAKSKAKIIDYYNQNCNNILAEVNLLEKTNRFDEALYKLTAVPEACNACYTRSMARAEAIFSKAIDFDCKTKLSEAQQIWNAKPNSEGAAKAATILRGINPNAKCFGEVKKLGATIGKKMNVSDAREWQIFYEQTIGLEKNRIEAIREIGKAYGQGQAKSVAYVTKGWW